MNLGLCLFLLGLNYTAAVLHSLQYFSTFSSQVPNFPEYVEVGYVDEVLISRYDSNTRTAEPKQEWMRAALDEKYWERNTENSRGNELMDKVNMERVKQRFNQTGGVHIVQRMIGCEWDDETDYINGYFQYGFDGEDFIALDLKTETFVAPRPQAVITKHGWERIGEAQQQKDYITTRCQEWLKKYLKHGEKTLLRTELPSVFLLQRTPSSPLRCLASGFYPHRADLFWTRDGEELQDQMKGQILPNHDGTFQMSTDLDLSSVQPGDWDRYACVFQLSGVPQDIVTELDKSVIKTNYPVENPDVQQQMMPQPEPEPES